MKRDMDLVRKILLAVEDSDEEDLRNRWLEVDGFDRIMVARHVEIMAEANLVDALVARADNSPAQAARVYKLTWAGYDFLDAIRNESTWSKTKQFVKEKLGSASFEIVKAVAVKIAHDQLNLPTLP